MSKLTEEYLKHIVDEIIFLEDKSRDIDEADLLTDELLQHAFTRSLEIIGEAIKQVPSSFREAHSEIDWKSFA